MDKIFRRTTMSEANEKKKKAPVKRKRNQIMNFRVSEEEKEQINERIALSGLSKSEFFIESCMHQKITVRGNVRTFEAIKEQVRVISEEVNKNPKLDEMDVQRTETLRTILEIMNNLFGGEADGKEDIRRED